MIILRQKSFNTAVRKALLTKEHVNRVSNSKLGSIAANVISKVNKAKATALRGIEQTTGLPSLHGKVQQAENLSNPVNAAKKVGRFGKKANTIVEEISNDPGSFATRLTEGAIRNPGTSAGFVADSIATVSSPAGALLPIKELGIALNTKIKENPTVKRLTEGTADRFSKSTVVKPAIRNTVNAGANMLKLVAPV